MFEGRLDAADRPVALLAEHDFDSEVIVAISRGGVPIGHRVAGAFGVPLVVLSVKKIGAPSNPECAVGAVTDGDVVYLDERAVRALGFDDGLATGATVRACCRQVRALGATAQVVAVPVASPRSVAELWDEGWTMLAVETPPNFSAVSQFYVSFPQVGDDEVRALLSEADTRQRTNT